MKKLLTLSAIALAITAMGQKAEAATADGSAVVDLRALLTVTETTGLDYGVVAADLAAGGTATMDTAGNVTCPAGWTCPAGQQGVFDITGDGSSTVNVSYTAGVLADTVSGTTMNFTPTGAATVDLSATSTLNVGGDLVVGAGQAAGIYDTANTGDGGAPYTVTVVY